MNATDLGGRLVDIALDWEHAYGVAPAITSALAEAHAYGDLESYVRSLLDVAPDDLPIDRLAGEAVNGTEARLQGNRPEVVYPAVRSALRGTVFRFEHPTSRRRKEGRSRELDGGPLSIGGGSPAGRALDHATRRPRSWTSARRS